MLLNFTFNLSINPLEELVYIHYIISPYPRSIEKNAKLAVLIV